MGDCPTQVFEEVTREQFKSLLARAGAADAANQGDEGQGTASGVTIRWKFTEADQRLELECLSKPAWVPCGIVNQQINNMVEASRAGLK